MLVTSDVTTVEADRIVFRLPDPGPAVTRVQLWSEVPVEGSEFSRTDVGWSLEVPHPGAHRVEYLFTITRGSGDAAETAMVVDPTNPLQVDGVFGAHSWLPLPGYTPPAWLDAPRVPATLTPCEFATADGLVSGAVWQPAEVEPDRAPTTVPDLTRLPLLVCHDGSQMARYGGLADFVAASIATGALPPMRLLLLDPGPHRDDRYAANARYSTALVTEILPAVTARHPTAGKPVVMGQSLGAVAALHAARRHPGTFAGLFLQSGSFFTPAFDPQERGYSHWAQVTGFTSTLYTAAAPETLPTMVVCGSEEENLANNRALASHLSASVGEVGWGEVPDGHTWTTWRDLLDPYLTRLLLEAWT
ncbi:alpha/beta hydrolase [Micropruina sonneratiae]|uniref:alpha/beta hydrolase n=1 Tax=Micropruina sonneratiae TaxID=2986940 RepID=UPI0022268682|nr:alpha/beta hydrolase-fold protein [Micropruina sp. KQZ13P-5]MCW3159363.1 alpha/beta hydrolase-fold protein [Micropruina sp. KQZ13P-5]